MRLEIATDLGLHRIDEPVRFVVRISNDGATPALATTELAEERFLARGVEEDSLQRSWAQPPVVTLAPGASLTVERSFELDFHRTYRAARLERVPVQLIATALIDGVPTRVESPVFEIEVDLRETSLLAAPDGSPSHYVTDGKRTLYVSSSSRSFEPRTRKLAIDRASLRVVSPSYLVDRKAVYRNGRRQSGVSPEGFRVLNAVFARNDSVVLTSYGNAKVAAPARFEALDDGDNTAWSGDARVRYRGGYGRDDQSVYFFTEESGTPHAVRVRACKDPSRFVALGRGQGRDDRHVYAGAVAIAGADPATWTMLSAWYARDARHVFYGDRKLDADVASFALLDPPDWARDARGYFERGQRSSEEAFAARR